MIRHAANALAQALARQPKTHRKPEINWTPTLIAYLRLWWDRDGKSVREIQEAFEYVCQLKVSRNAILGKAHRLKLTPRASPIRPKASRVVL